MAVGTPDGVSALFAFDLKTGVGRISVPFPSKPSTCNDITIGPDGAAYVTNTADHNVTVIDSTTDTPLGVILPTAHQPLGVGVAMAVHRAYITSFGSNTVTVIDTTTNMMVGTPIPVGAGPIVVGTGS